jgi:hypothetical protein
MTTLAEIKKELKGFKSYTIRGILIQSDEDGISADLCLTITDFYGNFDSEYISLGNWADEKEALKRARYMATKFNTEVEISNC